MQPTLDGAPKVLVIRKLARRDRRELVDTEPQIAGWGPKSGRRDPGAVPAVPVARPAIVGVGLRSAEQLLTRDGPPSQQRQRIAVTRSSRCECRQPTAGHFDHDPPDDGGNAESATRSTRTDHGRDRQPPPTPRSTRLAAHATNTPRKTIIQAMVTRCQNDDSAVSDPGLKPRPRAVRTSIGPSTTSPASA